MKPFLQYAFLLLFPMLVQAQAGGKEPSEKNLSIVKNFIHQLADEDVAVDVVLSQFVLVNEPSDELYDYLEVSLEEIRINLMNKKTDLIQYKNYRELAKKEVRDIDPEGLNVDNMYFLYYKDRLMTSLYVEAGKIASFTLVSKGDEMAHFVTY